MSIGSETCGWRRTIDIHHRRALEARMFPEPDSSRPIGGVTRTHRRRTMHLRQHHTEPTTSTAARRATAISVVVAALVVVACATPTDDFGLTVITTPSDAARARTEVATATPESPPGDGMSVAPDTSAAHSGAESPDGSVSVSDAFAALVRRRVVCLTNPQRCDVADFAAPGSSEARRMGDTVARFRREGLRLSPQRGRLELSVNSVTLDPESGDVVVDSCERDSHVLVDARFNALGEIIVDESVVTTRARWHLVDTARTAAATSDARNRSPQWRVGRVDIVTRRHGGVPCSHL